MWYQFSSEASAIISGAVRAYRSQVMDWIHSGDFPYPWDRGSLVREAVLCDRICDYIANVNNRFLPGGRERDEGV